MGTDSLNSKMQVNGKQFTSLLIMMGLILAVVFTTYVLIDQQVDENLIKNPRNFFGDVDTDAKKWLNGNLGMFFRFRYFGNVAWLGLPVLWYLLFTFRRRKPWQLTLMLVLIFLLLIIGFKGGRNYRHHFTVFPILVAMILFFIWQVVQNRARWVRSAVLLLIVGLCLFNFAHYSNWYTFFWKVSVGEGKKNFPYKTIRFLEERRKENPNAAVLVCNQPFYFYYLDGGGVEYRHPGVKMILQRDGDRRKIFNVLHHQFGIKYILFDFRVEATQRTKVFSEIINMDCTRVLFEGGLRLVALRDRPFEEEIPPRAFKTYNIWLANATNPEDTAPRLFQTGHTWKFFLEFEKTPKGNILHVIPKKVIKTRKLIDLGYRFDGKELGTEDGAPIYAYFTVTGKISKGSLTRDSFIYIEDFVERGEQEKLYFSRSEWRTYMVKKRVRPGVHTIVAGVKFAPKKKEDTLKIMKMGIHFLNNER